MQSQETLSLKQRKPTSPLHTIPAIPSWSVLASHLQDTLQSDDQQSMLQQNLIVHDDAPKIRNRLRFESVALQEAEGRGDSALHLTVSKGMFLASIAFDVFMTSRYPFAMTFRAACMIAFGATLHRGYSYALEWYREQVRKRLTQALVALDEVLTCALRLIRVAEVKCKQRKPLSNMSSPLARIEYNKWHNGIRSDLQCLSLRRALHSELERCAGILGHTPWGDSMKIANGEEHLLFILDQKVSALRQWTPEFTTKTFYTIDLIEAKRIAAAILHSVDTLESTIQLAHQMPIAREENLPRRQLPKEFRFVMRQVAEISREAQSDVLRCNEEATALPTRKEQLKRIQSYQQELSVTLKALQTMCTDLQLAIQQQDQDCCKPPVADVPPPKPTLHHTSFQAKQLLQQPSEAVSSEADDITLVFQETVEPLAEVPSEAYQTQPVEEAIVQTEFMGELVGVLKDRSSRLPPEKCRIRNKLVDAGQDLPLAGPLEHRASLIRNNGEDALPQVSSSCLESPNLLQELRCAIQQIPLPQTLCE